MRAPSPDERGAAFSVLVVVALLALLLMTGLVVDGGAQLAAQRQAQAVAAQAARAGSDASAAARLAGRDGSQAAGRAARQVLDAHPELRGQVLLGADGELRVATTIGVPTTFLSLIGIDRLDASGEAGARLIRR